MTELFEICSKIVFRTQFSVLFAIGGGEAGQERCQRGVLTCQG